MNARQVRVPLSYTPRLTPRLTKYKESAPTEPGGTVHNSSFLRGWDRRITSLRQYGIIIP